MYEATGIRRYQESDVASLGPEKLLVALYETMDQECERARRQLQRNDRVAMLHTLKYLQDILSELRNSLDHEIGGDVSRNLEALYDFMFHENLQMMADRDPAHLDHVQRVIAPLLDAWRRIPPGTAERARRELAGEEPADEAGPDPATAAPRQAAPATGAPFTREPVPAGETPHGSSICVSA